MSAFRFHVSAVFINFWARKNDTYKGWACEACEAYENQTNKDLIG